MLAAIRDFHATHHPSVEKRANDEGDETGTSDARSQTEDKVKVFFAFPEGSCRKVHRKLSDGNDKEVHEKTQPDEQAYLAVAPNFGDNVVDDVRNGKN